MQLDTLAESLQELRNAFETNSSQILFPLHQAFSAGRLLENLLSSEKFKDGRTR